MQRRAFLAALGASAAGLAWPRLIRRAFADASLDAPGAVHPSPSLAAARARAQAANKPLLIIVIPADDTQKYRRGDLWGEYLNHGTRAQLAPLALAEVSCATMKQVHAFAPGVAGEPLAVLLDPRGGARVLDGKLPEYNYEFGKWDPKSDEKLSDRRIAGMASLVRGALGMPADADAAGARVIKALRQAPVPGSHWANKSGCGPATVEDMKDDEVVAVGCGMGHIPSKSSRFLYFFSKTPMQMERQWAAAQEKKAKR